MQTKLANLKKAEVRNSFAITCPSPNLPFLSSMVDSLALLGENLLQPWDPQTRAFFSSRRTDFLFCAKNDQERWAREDFRVLSRLFDHLESSSGPALQVILPSLCLAFKDRLTAATSFEFPHGRTFVRRSSGYARLTLERLEKGETLPLVSEERKLQARKMCGLVDEGAFTSPVRAYQNLEGFRALLGRLDSIRQVWRPYPECLIDIRMENAEKITIERFHKGKPAPGWTLKEAEELQQRWWDQGKRGTGRVFDALFLKGILDDPKAESTLIRFGYGAGCLGYYLLQADPAAISLTNRSRLDLLNNGARLRVDGVKTGWATLCVLNTGDSLKAFERELDTPAYPFVTSIAQDCGIAEGTELFGGIVRLGNPAAAQHALLGFIDTRQIIDTPFGQARIIVLPTDLPEPMRQNIMLSGQKKRLS